MVPRHQLAIKNPAVNLISHLQEVPLIINGIFHLEQGFPPGLSEKFKERYIREQAAQRLIQEVKNQKWLEENELNHVPFA